MNRLAIGACVLLASSVWVAAQTDRPTSWATPITLEGVPNLHKVSDTLYRSAQPTDIGMQELKSYGIKTVINLRAFHSDRDILGQTGLAYEHIDMTAWHPEREDVVRFLRLVTDPARAPVLVHCQHGADRTGTMCALYRIVVQGWTKEDAIREMTQGGFGFHEVWSNLPAWIDELDIGSLWKEVKAP
ncbi:MAG TPA: dual specificity protein phosphatase family protein [Kiritimatiellia bacterium]|nr:dual specificity protein phosphatase family protein [Kiritimatiellia bacterium]